MGTIQWMSFPRKNVLDAIQRIASDDFFDAIEISHFALHNRKHSEQVFLNTVSVFVSSAKEDED